MILLTQCWDYCRNFWTFLKWNCYQHLTLICMVCHIQQIWFLLLWWNSLLTTLPFSLLLGNCCDSLQHTNNFSLLSWNMSTPSPSHCLSGMSWCMAFSLGCVCWRLKHVVQFFTCFSMSLLILTQFTDSCSSLVFSLPIWLTWSWSSACYFRSSGIIMHLPFMTMPSMTARSSL